VREPNSQIDRAIPILIGTPEGEWTMMHILWRQERATPPRVRQVSVPARASRYRATNPPSTGSATTVTNDAPGEHRQTATLATSSGSRRRFIGCDDHGAVQHRRFDDARQMAFTRMLRGASLIAVASVGPIIPCFDAV